MSATLTLDRGASGVYGHRRVRVYDIALSSTYPDGGESITPANVGLRKIENVTFHQMGQSTDRETATVSSFDYSASTLLLYESGASGAPLGEKTDSEAYITGAAVRATFTGW